MVNSHTKDEVLNKLYFAIDNIINVYANYDEYKINDLNRLIYTKYFESTKSVNLRVVLEKNDNRLEICSIHFQKHK